MKQGWQIKRLGEICDILNGFAFKSNEYVKEGVRVIRITNVQKGRIVDEDPKYFPVKRSNEILKYILQDGDLLMSLTGNVGRVGIISSSLLPAALNQRVACLRIKDKTISIKYLFHLLNSNLFEKDCISSASGIAQLNMSTKWLEQYEMVIPPPSEQQRIVNLLDAECAKIDALKANAEKNLQNAKDLFQAALKKELEPKEGWKKDFLSKIAYISRGRSQHRPRNEASLYGGNYPFIQTGDIRDANGGTISTYNQTYSEIGLQQSKLWKKGTICITIAANIGETAILGMDACFPDSVVGIIPDNQVVCTDFLNYCLIKEKDELNEIAHGTAQKNINVAILEKVLITYPIEITIQQSIVARLDALNEKCKTLQANYEKTLILCEDLKQALLRKAFNGEI